MSVISRPLLTMVMLAGLLLAPLACPTPLMASEPMVMAFKLQPVQSETQLAQNSRRDRRDRGRIKRRNNDWIPYRSAPPRRSSPPRQQQMRQRRAPEQDDARDAYRRGEVLALDSIIRSVRDYCPGDFLDASLQRQGNGIFYRVRILRPSGKRVVLGVDARTGAVVGGSCR